MTSAAQTLTALSREQRALLFEKLRRERQQTADSDRRIQRRDPSLDPPPLSFAQERLWILDQLQPGLAAYNIPMAMSIRGSLVPGALEGAVREVIRRHEALRTTFAESAGQAVQVIAPAESWSLPLADLGGLPPELHGAEVERLVTEEAARSFDLERGPLLRATLVRLSPEEYALLLNMHHIVSDGWSMSVLVRELSALYGAAVRGEPSPLPELPVQYADFALWQREWLRGEELERQVSYWRERLAGVPASLDLPTDRPRPPVQSFQGRRIRFRLGPELAQGLATLGREQDATLFMVLFAGFQVLLWRYTGQEDFAVGSPIANRTRVEIDPLIGFFVNTLALRSDVMGALSFRELLARVRRTALEAYAHQDLPFERLVGELRPERHLSHNPLFQVMFALQNSPVGRVDLPGISLGLIDFPTHTAQFDLELSLGEMPAGLGGDLLYSTDLFDAPTIRRLAAHLETLLAGIVADPERRLTEFPLLAESERHQVALEWNDTAPSGPPEDVLVRFEAQVARSPETAAVEAGGDGLTYAELDRRANRLARHLRSLGVGPGTVVGLCLERSLDLPVGLLAICKAGGAWVPLDPGLPAARLAFLLEDSGAALVVGHQATVSVLEVLGVLVVLVEDPKDLKDSGDEKAARPTDLAYMIYTSGTTGQPKAVMVERGHLAATLDAVRSFFEPGDRMPCVAPFSFDIFLFELLGPLLAGGTSVLVPLRPTLDVDALAAELGEVTLLHAVPALMRRIADVVGSGAETALRGLFVGGDAVPAELLADLRRVFPRAWIRELYGPTEGTILCSAYEVEREGEARSLLGRPLTGAILDVRDPHGNRVPIGVPGEIWLGGAGVTRGYWRREELTAEKFVERGGRRFFKTGDLARLLTDGNLEFLGRIDSQVKVRGFRIELGEVESALARHPRVREAVVTARDDDPSGKRLVAYVVPGPASEADLEAAGHVHQWQSLYEETYGRSAATDPRFNLEGWNSSYTGEPIPEAEMREWVETTVERILALRPRRALEVGCGMGLILYRVAPQVERYVATDFSPTVLDAIRREIARSTDLGTVELRQRTADDWRGIEPGEFDLVILNSVVQYFPGAEYLRRVLESAVRTVAPTGGAVFVGDVRNLTLLEDLHASVERFRNPDLPESEIQSRVRRRVAEEEELLVDPQLFSSLPGLRSAEILSKQGKVANELTRFRYDVVLRAGEEESSGEALDWAAFTNDPLKVRSDRSLIADLRRSLQAELPDYMVPSAFLVLDSLPLTSHGKVDRAALPAPEPPRTQTGSLPSTPEEKAMAELWKEVLGIESVGVTDDFFGLGGHSLLATQLVSRIRSVFGLALSLRDLFETPILGALAAKVAAGQSRTAESVPVRTGDSREAPLSFSQERLWFLDRLTPGTSAYNIPGPLHLKGPLDAGVLERCFAELFRRHESLRTRFIDRSGIPVQVIDPPSPRPLPRVDLSALTRDLGRREAERLTAEEAGWPFDLERRPLFRPILLRLAPEEHVLLLTIHHIVSDGWSIGVLFRELLALYEIFAAGRRSPLPELTLQYADYARWQRETLAGAELQAQLAYWRDRLAGSPPALELPLDHPRPPVQTFRGASVPLELSLEVSERLKSLSLTEHASPFMVLLAAFKLLLTRLAGQEDVQVGVPIAGRSRAELEGLIGFFLNTLVLRTDLSGSPTFRELLRQVRETALGAYGHQDVPFERLLEDLQPERDLSRTPLFQVFFNMLNFPRRQTELPGGISVEPLGWGDAEAKFDITVYAAETEDGRFGFNLVYNADLFDRARMEELARQYAFALEQVADRPDEAIGTVSLRTAEAAAVLPDPREPLGAEWMGAVHDLFLARARQHPERIAVEDAAGSWTYGELAEKVERLAAALQSAGVGKGDRVAIYAHRSAPVAWAVLATLRAGGVFVMLDPAYPAPRLAEMLLLAEPRAFIALEAAGEVSVKIDSVARLTLPCDLETLPERAEPVAVGPDDIAYIAFTSGSTGVPKGILGRHGPLTHFLPWQCERFALGQEDRYSLLSGLAHDPLQRDLFTPLCTGGAVCVPTMEEIATPGRLAVWMAECKVTVAHLTPAMGQILTETGATQVDSLRRVLLVGDVLTRLDVDRLHRLAPQAQVVNLYGSTETQRAVAYHAVDEADPSNPSDRSDSLSVLPLGRGMKDVQLLVVNSSGALAGVGEVGEIQVRSPHLAAGYLGDPELTREKFQRQRYRTGDLGRYLPNGEVAFAGRADLQVKIRGFRIELGEIEATLGRLPGVREAVVVARQDGPAAERRLVAYVVPDPEAKPAVEELREGLRRQLPAYMVPSAFVLLARLPVTPNNKVDRRALPVPELEVAAAYVEPQSELEQMLAGVWAEVLGIEKVGVTQNFFDLGGHSLLLVRLHARLQEALGRELTLVELFNYPNVRALAEHLGRSVAAAPAAQPQDRAKKQIEAARRQKELAKARRTGSGST